MRSGFERGFAIALAVLLLVLALAAQFLQSKPESIAGSVASSQPAGRRALSLLLRDLGVRAEAWNDAPASLPRDGALLWLARPPSRAGTTSEAKSSETKPSETKPQKEATEVSPADLGLRSFSHYRRFVEEGGTLLLPESDAAHKFLEDSLGFSACGEVHPSRVAKAGVRRIRNEGREELEVEVREGGVLVLPDSGSVASPLWRGGTIDAEGDDVLAMVVPEGRGQVVLLGDDSFLDNAHIGEHDHALFAVRLAEELAPGKRVLFDDYALGLWTPRSPIAILASPSLFLASLHLLLLLALLVVRSAWVREFPRDPAPLASASPLLRARTLAALLERSGRYGLLGSWLKDGTARRLDRRSRAAAAAVRDLPRTSCQGAEDLERLERTLAAIERSAG